MASKSLNIFFDFDGTLLDVSVRNYRVYSEITKDFGGQPLAKTEYWELKRKKTKWPTLLPQSSLNPEIEPVFLSRFIEKIETVKYLRMDQLFPESIPTLAKLSLKHNCFLVSLRRNHQNLRQQLGWLGLADYFTEILSGHSEGDGYDKKIELISRRLSHDGRDVIIGDTEADIVTGKELDMTTIGVSSGIRDRQFLQTLQPDYMVDSVGQITSLPFL